MDIQLNFINRSNDMNNSQIVIFQKNVASGYNELAVAWQVIQNCGLGDNHPFVYPQTMQVSASDSYGNYTPQLDAQPGDAFAVTCTGSGDTLARNGNATYPTEVQIQNGLQQGAINASIYKNGSMLALKTSIAPGQMAAFEFQPTIWIGAVSQVNQGQIMNSAIVETVNTELSLLGVAAADIVMTGGGPGRNSTAFQFTLQNVRMA
ncbi:MAG TPA: hypothetical protein VE891_07645 [Allosphingosinicella sp.]|nr:hypothetical protein [Allosphingosinicella sp.]